MSGDLQAVLRAILLDPEARDDGVAAGASYGKLREPMLRFAAWARAFGATSPGDAWAIGDTADPATRLGQSPLRCADGLQLLPSRLRAAEQRARAGRAWSRPSSRSPTSRRSPATSTSCSALVADGIGDVRANYAALLALAADCGGAARRAEPRARRRPARAGDAGIAASSALDTIAAAHRRRPPQPHLRRAGCWSLAAPEYHGPEMSASPDGHDMTASASRRAFLHRAAALSLAGGAAPWALNLAAIGEAAAADRHRLQGAGLRLPVRRQRLRQHARALRPASYALYRASRPTLAYARGSLARRRCSARASRCRAAANTRSRRSSRRCCRSSMPGRWRSLLNVGTLVQPTTKAQYTGAVGAAAAQALLAQRPAVLLAVEPARGRDVGLGRAHRRPVRQSGNGNATFTCVNVSGNAVFLSGADARCSTRCRQQRLGGPDRDQARRCSARRHARTRCAPSSRASRTHLFEDEHARVTSRSIDANESLTAALAGGAGAADGLPDRQQPGRPAEDRRAHDRQRRRARREAAGVLRLARRLRHPRRAVDDASRADDAGRRRDLARSTRRPIELGVANQVTTFTASDFGRTLVGNGNGSDHGWGSMHFVLGGAVRGGRYFGTRAGDRQQRPRRRRPGPAAADAPRSTRWPRPSAPGSALRRRPAGRAAQPLALERVSPQPRVRLSDGVQLPTSGSGNGQQSEAFRSFDVRGATMKHRRERRRRAGADHARATDAAARRRRSGPARNGHLPNEALPVPTGAKPPKSSAGMTQCEVRCSRS